MIVRSLFLITALQLASLRVLACTNDTALVCGYWMHTSKTATFQNECKMREQGAQMRHSGACADPVTKKSTQTGSAKTNK